VNRTYETDHGTVTFTRAPIAGLSYVYHDGAHVTMGHADTTEAMRETAADREARAADYMRRARRLRAVADALDAYRDDLDREHEARRGRKVVGA